MDRRLVKILGVRVIAVHGCGGPEFDFSWSEDANTI